MQLRRRANSPLRPDRDSARGHDNGEPEMIEILLIGIGTGNPDHLTLQAIKAIRSADLILVPLKGDGKSELAAVRRRILAAAIPGYLTASDAANRPDVRPAIVEFDLPKRDTASSDYKAAVDDWHDAIAETWQREISSGLDAGTGRVALLIWGDPSLYDSSLRITGRLAARMPLNIEVIPGVTSLQGLTAAHCVPLNAIGESVLITTGRKLRDDGWPLSADTVAVMLDGENSFTHLDPTGLKIWWGAYVGMPQQLTISGMLQDVGPRIVETRADARKRMGWIMDIYILRKSDK